MKKYLKTLLLMAAAGCMTACSLDELPTENKPKEDGVGYLQIGGIEIVGDTENSSVGDNPEFTRATSPATDDYFIEIVESTKGLVWSGSYATVKSLNPSQNDQTKKGIALEPGTYVVHAYQTQKKAPESNDATVDAPYYAGESELITIEKGTTAEATVTCHLANIRVTVELSADLVALFKNYESTDTEYEDYRLKTLVEVGTGTGTEGEKYPYTFEKTATHPVEGTTSGGPIVYFKDVAGPNSTAGNTMSIRMSGMYYTGDPVDIYGGGTIDQTEWKYVVMNKTVANVKAGQWRKISIDIDHNTTGDVQFIFTIESYVYDEEINVTTETFSTLLSYEESIPEDDINDPLAPQVTIDGNAAGVMAYTIDASKYDPDASTDNEIAWSSRLKAIVTPQGTSKVQRLYAKLMNPESSTTLAAAMQTKGFVDGNGNYIISLYPEPMTTGANEYVNVADDGTKVTLTNKGMSALFKHPGTHVFRLATESDDSHSGFGDITITVSSGSLGNGPTVVWMKDGVDVIDQWHNLTSMEDYETEITITSETGITGMTVDIQASRLTPGELAVLGLSQHMDLLDPGSGETESGLRSLGFIATESGSPGTAYDMDDFRMYYPNNEEVYEENANKRIEGRTSPLLNAKEITFSVTKFTGLLWALYGGESDDAIFTLTVSHAGGTTVKQIQYRINP